MKDIDGQLTYVIKVPHTSPATDKALLDEIIGCLTEYAVGGDPKNLRVARAHINALLILACIDYSTGHPEVGEMTWEDPLCL